MFVDIFETVSCVLNFQGKCVRMGIVGRVQMKAFVNAHREMSLALNEDVTVASGDGKTPPFLSGHSNLSESELDVSPTYSRA